MNLPLLDSVIELYLKPIVRAELATSPLWKNSETKQDAKQRGEKAEQEVYQYTVNTMGLSHNRVGTKKGF